MLKKVLFTGAAGITLLSGQEPLNHAERDVITFVSGVRPGPGAAGTFDFIGSEFSAGNVVKGAPYSAESVNERVQVLGDGNRIVSKSSSTVARDSQGRTRREHTFPVIGPWASAGEAPVMVFINDPVSGESFVLNTKDKTARKSVVVAMPAGGAAEALGQAKAHIARQVTTVRKGQMIEQDHIQIAGGGGAAFELATPVFQRMEITEGKGESLGTQLIEGVKAEGNRTVMTIPAGQMGNERQIDIVTERWYSPELQVTLLTKHSDPRMGENTTKLTRVQRSEPHISMFQIPADYTVVTDDRRPRPVR